MQHLSYLGRIGLGSRLKRLSDHVISEVNAIYKDAWIQFEASCFPVLSLLERHGPMTLREAEKKLGTSHSYVSQKSKYLIDLGLIDVEDNQNDRRSKVLTLTPKGTQLITEARPYWKAMDKAFAEILHPEERQIFQALHNLEDRIMRQSFRDKVKQIHDRAAVLEIEMADYKPDYKQAFKDLNLEWLEKYFTLVPFDYEAFADPEALFLQAGGDIFFAVAEGQPVGTAALYPVGEGFELCKMGVDARYRGAGIGRRIIEEGMRRAKAKGAKKLELLTQSKTLAPAIRLYKAMGFYEVPLTEEDRKKYGRDRVDTRMEIVL